MSKYEMAWIQNLNTEVMKKLTDRGVDIPKTKLDTYVNY